VCGGGVCAARRQAELIAGHRGQRIGAAGEVHRERGVRRVILCVQRAQELVAQRARCMGNACRTHCNVRENAAQSGDERHARCVTDMRPSATPIAGRVCASTLAIMLRSRAYAAETCLVRIGAQLACICILRFAGRTVVRRSLVLLGQYALIERCRLPRRKYMSPGECCALRSARTHGNTRRRCYAFVRARGDRRVRFTGAVGAIQAPVQKRII
jgi:hypothetical protein